MFSCQRRKHYMGSCCCDCTGSNMFHGIACFLSLDQTQMASIFPWMISFTPILTQILEFNFIPIDAHFLYLTTPQPMQKLPISKILTIGDFPSELVQFSPQLLLSSLFSYSTLQYAYPVLICTYNVSMTAL